MVRSVFGVALVLVSGCSREGAAGLCEARALGEAATAVQAAVEAWTPADGVLLDPARAVGEAIWRGCPELPGALRATLDRTMPHRSDELDELPGHAALHDSLASHRGERRVHDAAICPDVTAVVERAADATLGELPARIYDGCRLVARGLFTRAEAVGPYANPDVLGLHALDHWLIAAGGVSPEVAHTLVRALNLDPFRVRPRDEQRLPHGDAVEALPERLDEVLFVGPERVAFESMDHPLTSASQEERRRVYDAMAQAFARKAPEEPLYPVVVPAETRLPIVMMVDRRVPGAALVEAVEMAAAAGFGDVDVAVVTPASPHLGVVRVASAAHVRPPVFGVHVTAQGATVRCEREVTEVTEKASLEATVAACRWKGRVPLRISGAPGVEVARVAAAYRLQALEKLKVEDLEEVAAPLAMREPPRDDPSRISVRVRAGDLVVTCHDEVHEVADGALASDAGRCAGAESGWIDVIAEADVPVQRIVEVAAAGRRAGKQVALARPPEAESR